MSGTSFDGIDASIIRTDGISINRTGINYIGKYRKTKLEILKAIKKPNEFIYNEKLKNDLCLKITEDHVKACKLILKKTNTIPDLIGFHGQTIIHDQKNKLSLQLGSGSLLSKILKIKVVCNFRKNDIQYDGKVPISPIYHKYLIETLKLTLPTIFLNIGGISNLTYWDGKELIACDTGPGNNLIDFYMRKRLN